MTPDLRLSVIIPVCNGGDAFARCLRALFASSRLPDACFVVDDGSEDGSVELARSFGASLLKTPAPRSGPAVARNLGAKEATGDILAFVDADVMLHEDALAKIEAVFLEEAEVAALFGSYDDAPTERNCASLYKNLLHHFVHQNGNPDASTFWAGCGAVRRVAFEKAGGFSERYKRPSIEDIELGYRLRMAGEKIALRPDILCAHAKRWTLRSLWKTDIFQRAIPWSLLISQSRQLPRDLNVDVKGRLSAATVWGALAGVFAAGRTPLGFVAFLGFGGLFCLLNATFFALLLRRGGIWATIGGAFLHALYFLYSSLIFVGVLVASRLSPSLRRGAGGAIR